MRRDEPGEGDETAADVGADVEPVDLVGFEAVDDRLPQAPVAVDAHASSSGGPDQPGRAEGPGYDGVCSRLVAP
jgi:hypothetical protein